MRGFGKGWVGRGGGVLNGCINTWSTPADDRTTIQHSEPGSSEDRNGKQNPPSTLFFYRKSRSIILV